MNGWYTFVERHGWTLLAVVWVIFFVALIYVNLMNTNYTFVVGG